MNRTLPPNVKEHIVLMWQDTDVPDIIRDRVFGGKLAHVNNNVESDKGNFDSLLTVSKSAFGEMYLRLF